MSVDESAGLREQLDEQAGAQSEGERELELAKAGVVDDAPLEADEPEVEVSHPGAERGEDDFG